MATIATLAVDLTANTDNLVRGLNNAQAQTKSWANRMVSNVQTVGTVALGVFAGVTAAAGAAAAGLGLYIKDATLAAARVSEMAAVLDLLGARAGWSAGEIEQNVDAMKGLGIRTDVAQGLLAQFARYQLDAARATDLAAVAQDAAVLSMQDSSDALDQIMHGILTQNTRVLRNAGLNIQAGQAVEEYADSLGVAASELDATQRIQAVMNAVLAEGEKIAGTYTTAMQEPGKQLRSLSRHFYEAKVAAGDAFLPAFGNVIAGVTDGIKWVRALLEEGEPLNRIFGALGDIAAAVTEHLFGMAGAGEGLYGVLDQVATILETASSYIQFFFHRLSWGEGVVDSLIVVLNLLGLEGLATFIEKAREAVGVVLEFLEPVMTWISNNIELKDVLLALAVAIGVVVVGALKTIVVFAAPVIATFVLMVATVALLRKAWETNFMGIRDKTQAVISFVRGFITDALAFIQTFWANNGAQIIATVTNTFNTVRNIITTVIGVVRGVIQGALEMIRGWWGAHGDNVITIVSRYMEMARNTIATVIGAIRAVIEAALAYIQFFWKYHGDTIISVASIAWEAIKLVVDTVIHNIEDIIAAVSAAIQGDWEGFGEALRRVWDRSWEALQTALGLAVEAIWEIIKGLISTSIKFFTDTDWGQVGRDIIAGIVSGLSQSAFMLSDAIRGAARAALDSLKGFLGISSASKVFRDQIGKESVAGWAQGLLDTRPIEQAVTQAAEVSVGAVAQPVGAASGGGEVHTHYHLTANYKYQDEVELRDDVRFLTLLKR